MSLLASVYVASANQQRPRPERRAAGAQQADNKTGNDNKRGKGQHDGALDDGRFQAWIASNVTAAAPSSDDLLPDVDLLEDCHFDFENLVFEGGGNKGLSYIGALEVLESVGIMSRIKRVAGASVGAMTATLVAIGFTAQEMREQAEDNLKDIIVDHSCGLCSFIPNIVQGFGWNPGNRLLKWFGAQLKERTGNADVTFKELYHICGRELCIVVTNLSQMTTEYLHPKTAPDMPVRVAVRMSMAMPGVFQSVRYRLNGRNDLYVDGGLLCNYPVHAFDGWWLSMKAEDSFFKRLQRLDDFPRLFERAHRFGTWNSKTLGLVLYSFSETELMKTLLVSRASIVASPRQPNTKLYRKRKKLQMKEAASRLEHEVVVQAVDRFMQELHRLSLDTEGIVSRKGLEKVFKESTVFTPEDQVLLFGEGDHAEAFEELDHNKDGNISFQELMSFVEQRGVCLHSRFLGYRRRDINNLGDFVAALQSCLSVNIKRTYIDERDIDRTIGIDTDYIETNDYELDDMDKRFLIEAGARATKLFLREHVVKNPNKIRRIRVLPAFHSDSSHHGSDRTTPSSKGSDQTGLDATISLPFPCELAKNQTENASSKAPLPGQSV